MVSIQTVSPSPSSFTWISLGNILCCLYTHNSFSFHSYQNYCTYIRMQRGNGSPAACAACKHQRKRCDENCALAPYFPASKTREFQAVHKVYGMSNVIKILRSIESEDERRRAADSLVWEAVCRQRDPVLGSYGEFKKVVEELKFYKSQNQQLQEAYTRASELIRWSSSSNGMSTGGCRNNGLNYVNNNGNSRLDSTTAYGYPRQVQIQEEVRAETDVASAVHVPQQHSTNGFTQQYCFPGELTSMNDRTMESTVIWEGGS